MKLRKAYLCGPTLYAKPHLGNIKTFYCAITHFRKNKKKGDVLMMNLTDVNQKIDEASNYCPKKALSIVNNHSRYLIRVLRFLGLKPWTLDIVRVTWHLKDLKKDIRALEKDKSWTFKSDQKGIYAIKKENYVWNQENKGAFYMWRSGLGMYQMNLKKGNPGWHNQCATLIKKYLDLSFTHYGGIDLKQIHHKNQEQIISTFKNYKINWVHVQPIVKGTEKISKSLGTAVDFKFDARYKEYLANLGLKARNESITLTEKISTKQVNLRSHMRRYNPIKKLFFNRLKAKQKRLYEKADFYRAQLRKRGYLCRDEKRGFKIYKCLS